MRTGHEETPDPPDDGKKPWRVPGLKNVPPALIYVAVGMLAAAWAFIMLLVALAR